MNFSGNWHPIFVHFPVALLSLYVGIVVLAFIWKSKASILEPFAKILIVLGALGAVVAAMAGEGLEKPVETLEDPIITATLVRHALYAGVTQTLAVLAAVLQFWPLIRTKIKFLKFNIHPLVHVGLAGLIFASLLLTASEGGKLAHTYHVGEKANLEIAHPVGGLSEMLIPQVLIDQIEG